MSKSLNQAFIKAYSKEERSNAQAEEVVRDTESAQPASSVAEAVGMDFLIRFDTATMPPSTALRGPHSLAEQPSAPSGANTETTSPREDFPGEVASEVPTAAPQRTVPTNRIDAAVNSYQQTSGNAGTPATDSTPPAPKLHSTGPGVRLKRTEVVYSEPAAAASTDAEIRNSIASQMQQAGHWEVASFDTLVQPTPSQPAPQTPPQPQLTQASAVQHQPPVQHQPVLHQPAQVQPPSIQLAAPQAAATETATQPSAATSPASIQSPSQPALHAAQPVQSAQPIQPAQSAQSAATRGFQAVDSYPELAFQPARPLEAAPSVASEPPTPTNTSPAAAPEGSIPESYAPEARAAEVRATETHVGQETAVETPRTESPATNHYTQVQPSHGHSTPSLPPQPPAQAPELAPLDEPAVDQFVRRDDDGEIFRLDRPSYSSPDTPDESEVSEAESSQSLTSVDVATSSDEAISTSATTPQSVAKSEPEPRTDSPGQSRSATSEIEQQLRAAKQRIFNPVWEVDRLSWPAVCADLLLASGEQMDSVAENLATACEEGLEVMAVTSPQGGEGRTTIACCLAILAASRGMRVALVDADLESPSIAARTNLDIQQDWRTAIDHQMPLEDVAIHSIDDQTTLIPLISGVEEGEISSLDDRIGAMFEELTESFDLVIADMGHMASPHSLVGPLGETGVVDAVITVINRQQTTASQVESCVERIRKTGIVSIGLVENFMA